MGGLRNEIPFTFWMMMIGTLALTGVGIPFTLDRLRRLRLEGRDHRGGLRLAAARRGSTPSCASSSPPAFTSFYSWRLIFMTFFGERGDWLRPAHVTRIGADASRPISRGRIMRHDDHGHGDHGGAHAA